MMDKQYDGMPCCQHCGTTIPFLLTANEMVQSIIVNCNECSGKNKAVYHTDAPNLKSFEAVD